MTDENKYLVTVDGRPWEHVKTLRAAKQIKANLKNNDLFKKAEISIYGPNGGKY